MFSIDSNPPPPSRFTLSVKRSFDVLAAGTALIVLSPIFALIAVLIRLDSSGPSFFLQERVGRNGRPFVIRKFRSMVVRSSEDSALTVRNDARVTRLGVHLRRHKLDELPQLINVLLGDMSLVGPRPEVPDLISLYPAHQRAVICSVRPGVTDYASILFRDESAFLDGHPNPEAFYASTIVPIKYRHVQRYIDEIGFWTDLRIILATVAMLIAGRPIFISRLLPDGASLQTALAFDTSSSHVN